MSLDETVHRDALISYLVMEIVAIEGKNELEKIERDTKNHVYDNYDEMTALKELERQLS